MFNNEMMNHCKAIIFPYWKGLIDRQYGGFYGHVDYHLTIDQKAEKGVILNSRILWFFASGFLAEKDEELLIYAKHAYDFMIEKCMDKTNGGVYWMLAYNGSVKESMKHTYNQAFAIYALSAYYEAGRDQNALNHAIDLFHQVETVCTDAYGYLEAFTKDWHLIDNEKLSENGLLADKTMNTLLHVLEAYTQLYKVWQHHEVKNALTKILNLFKAKVFNKEKNRLEVFFDIKMNTIADLHSYGHDIEASWLLDAACDVLQDSAITEMTRAYTTTLAETILEQAYEHGALNNECFKGAVDRTRVWWVQAEAVVGFHNAYTKTKDPKYLDAANHLWQYIQQNFVDARPGGEWFWDLDPSGKPVSRKPITEPWKCPYHNGRMCFEMNRRG